MKKKKMRREKTEGVGGKGGEEKNSKWGRKEGHGETKRERGEGERKRSK